VDNPLLCAFLSYAREDDKGILSWISNFRKRLDAEVRLQLGSGFRIFQDAVHISWGQSWRHQLQEAIESSLLFIPIVTPGYLASESCRNELKQFLRREQELGRTDLILPVYLAGSLEFSPSLEHDHLLDVIRSRQALDWRKLRHYPFDHVAVSQKLAEMAEALTLRLRAVNQRPIARSRLSYLLYIVTENSEREFFPTIPLLIKKGETLPHQSSRSFVRSGAELQGSK
jgi:hypothetical protein